MRTLRDRRADTTAGRPCPRMMWVPVWTTGAYVLLMVVFLPRLIDSLYWSSDVASTTVLGERLTRPDLRPATAYVTQPLYVVMNVLTRHLPMHRYVWELVPLGMTVATLALVVWSVRQVASRWAAATAGALAIAASPEVLKTYLAQNFHGTTWFCCALLAAFLVLLMRRLRLPTSVVVVLAILVAAITGVAAASDPLLVVAGIAPFVIVGLVALRTAPAERGSAFVIFGIAAGSLVVTGLGRVWFSRAGFVMRLPSRHPLRPASPSVLLKNLGLLIRGYFAALNGVLTVPKVGIVRVLMPLCVGLAVIAVPFVVKGVRRTSVLKRGSDGIDGPRFILAAYWSASAVLVALAFLFSRLPIDIYSMRYLVPLVFALAVLVPLTTERLATRRTLAAIAMTVFVLASIGDLIVLVGHGGYESPRAETLAPLAAFLEAHDLHRGYANYWTADSISWQTNDRVEILPVRRGCGDVGAVDICAYLQNVDEASYRPAPGPSFFVIDPHGPLWKAPSNELFGEPESVLHAGQYTVFVYGYDVGSLLRCSAPPGANCRFRDDGT